MAKQDLKSTYSSPEEFRVAIDTFIWNFNIGKNIEYNFLILTSLIKDDNELYNKPISIISVSIIEAILVDFIERLDVSTRHFPETLKLEEIKIKDSLAKHKKDFETVFLDEVSIYKKLKNFRYQDLVEICREHDLLGTDPTVYKNLQKMGWYRNRVHIKNYLNNFEKTESRTYSHRRTQQTIDYLDRLTNFMSKNYSRPW